MNTITLFTDVVALCPKPNNQARLNSKGENHYLLKHRKRKQNE
jgi:hypothetical protein